MKRARFFVPFERVLAGGDDDSVIVSGVVTSEAVDEYGTRFSWGATRKAIEEWDKYRNIREMHANSAVGVATDITLDDEARKLYIEAKIVDPVAALKVREGVYRGFSIGALARKMHRAEDGAVVIDDYRLIEVSVVDRPANPDALFTIVRALEEGEVEIGELLMQMWKLLMGDAEVPDTPEAAAGAVREKVIADYRASQESAGDGQAQASDASVERAAVADDMLAQRLAKLEERLAAIEQRNVELERVLQMPTGVPVRRSGETREERIARLKRELAGKQVPPDDPRLIELMKLQMEG